MKTVFLCKASFRHSLYRTDVGNDWRYTPCTIIYHKTRDDIYSPRVFNKNYGELQGEKVLTTLPYFLCRILLCN